MSSYPEIERWFVVNDRNKFFEAAGVPPKLPNKDRIRSIMSEKWDYIATVKGSEKEWIYGDEERIADMNRKANLISKAPEMEFLLELVLGSHSDALPPFIRERIQEVLEQAHSTKVFVEPHDRVES